MAQGYLFYGPRYRPVTGSGNVLPNGTLQFYYSQTTLPAPVYQDLGLTNMLSDPVQADSTGKFPVMYLDPSLQYRVQLYDKNGVLQEDTDPYVVPAGGSGGGGSGSPGSPGQPGADAVSLLVSTPSIVVPADSSGNVLDYGPAQGYLSVFSGTQNVTLSSQLSVFSETNVVGTINTAANTPVNSQPIGYYQITSLTALTGSITLQATYNGVNYQATVVIAKAVAGATGTPGSGTSAVTIYLTNPSYNLPAYANGTAPTYQAANGVVHVVSGLVDITSSCTLSAVPDANTTGTVNTATNTPVNGQPLGYYQITNVNGSTGTLTINAVYMGSTFTANFTVTKVNIGYELVTSLPITNLFVGRIVFDTVNNLLYKYNGTAWVPVVNATDLTGQLTANQIASITAAQLTGTLTTTQIGPNTIQTGNLAAGAVQTANLAAGSVTTGVLAAGAVTTANLAAGAVTANNIAANTITGNQIAAGTITSGLIAANSITGNNIAANTITSNNLQAGSINGSSITANTITSTQLATSGLITNSAQINNGVITSANIGALQVNTINLAGNSVTIPVSAFLASATGIIGSSGIPINVIQITINIPSTPTNIYVSAAATYQMGGNQQGQLGFYLARDSTIPGTNGVSLTVGTTTPAFNTGGNTNYSSSFATSVTDTALLSGTHTYQLQVYRSLGNGAQILTQISLFVIATLK